MIPPVVKTITCAELQQHRVQGPIDLIDVRTPKEFADIRAAGARNVPLDVLDTAAIVQERSSPPGAPLYFICAVGARSEWACKMMLAAGYDNVVNVEGGTQAWYLSGLPVEGDASGGPAHSGF
jgi:rhodanese-related sulfurtransferase